MEPTRDSAEPQEPAAERPPPEAASSTPAARPKKAASKPGEPSTQGANQAATKKARKQATAQPPRPPTKRSSGRPATLEGAAAVGDPVSVALPESSQPQPMPGAVAAPEAPEAAEAPARPEAPEAAEAQARPEAPGPLEEDELDGGPSTIWATSRKPGASVQAAGGGEADLPPAGSQAGLIVSLDGPASSGKSSVGAAAAVRLGYRFCDTGLLYRAVTWLSVRRNVWPEDAVGLVRLVDDVRLVADDDGRLRHVTVDGVDVTDAVHGPDVDALVSAVSRVPEVRSALLARQRRIAESGRIIMAGRDIGTVVLPGADLKLYLEATLHERALRRAQERELDPDSHQAREVLHELRRRDTIDSTRAVAPLRVPEGAVVLHTDGNTFDQTVEQVVKAVRAQEATTVDVTRRTSSEAGKGGRRRKGPPKPTPIAARVGPVRAVGGLVMRSIARVIVRIRVEGDLASIPRTGPLIVAANHASSADPVLIGAFLNQTLGRPLNWLGKRELVELPVIGWLMRQVPIHPVDRATADLEAFRTAMKILEAGNILAVFPEGTRSEDGRLQPAKDGAAVLALRSGAPVLPVAVGDSDLLWPKHSRLPKPGSRVTVRYGRPFRVAEELPPAPGGMDRRAAKEAATALIMARIAELLPERQRGVYGASPEPLSGARSDAPERASTSGATEVSPPP